MKLSNENPQIRIRPLSEGIGLGSLRNVAPRAKSTSQAALPTQQSSSGSQDLPVFRQAQVAYAPHSVGTRLRQRQSTRWYVGFWRFFAGVGADVFVGSLSAFVLAWAGVLAWNAGSSGEFNPLAALITITDVLEKFSALRVGVAVISIAVVWRSAKILLQPQPTV